MCSIVHHLYLRLYWELYTCTALFSNGKYNKLAQGQTLVSSPPILSVLEMVLFPGSLEHHFSSFCMCTTSCSEAWQECWIPKKPFDPYKASWCCHSVLETLVLCLLSFMHRNDATTCTSLLSLLSENTKRLPKATQTQKSSLYTNTSKILPTLGKCVKHYWRAEL